MNLNQTDLATSVVEILDLKNNMTISRVTNLRELDYEEKDVRHSSQAFNEI